MKKNTTSKHRAKKMQTNCEKMRTWSQLGAQDEKVRWTSMALDGPCEPHSVGPSAQTSKKAGSNHAGGGTPAHCDASRISAGVHFRESAPAGRNHAKHFQNLPTVCSKSPKSSQNFSPNPPQTLPKPSQSEPKSIQKPSWSPFWANA